MIGVGRRVDHVAPNAGAAAVDHAGNEGHVDPRGSVGDDRERREDALGHDLPRSMKSVPKQAGASVAAIEEPGLARGALVGGEVGVVTEDDSRRGGPGPVLGRCRSRVACLSVPVGRGGRWGRRHRLGRVGDQTARRRAPRRVSHARRRRPTRPTAGSRASRRRAEPESRTTASGPNQVTATADGSRSTRRTTAHPRGTPAEVSTASGRTRRSTTRNRRTRWHRWSGRRPSGNRRRRGSTRSATSNRPDCERVLDRTRPSHRQRPPRHLVSATRHTAPHRRARRRARPRAPRRCRRRAARRPLPPASSRPRRRLAPAVSRTWSRRSDGARSCRIGPRGVAERHAAVEVDLVGHREERADRSITVGAGS